MAQVLDFSPRRWSSGLRLVALVLADHASGEGACFPSISTLARRSGLSPRHVQRHLRILEAEGVIEIEAVFKKGRQTSNLFTWHFFDVLGDNSGLGVSPTTGGRVSPTTGGRVSPTTGG
jgi:DNA-binding transcriptional ArsR family regulator